MEITLITMDNPSLDCSNIVAAYRLLGRPITPDVDQKLLSLVCPHHHKKLAGMEFEYRTIDFLAESSPSMYAALKPLATDDSVFFAKLAKGSCIGERCCPDFLNILKRCPLFWDPHSN